MGNSTINYEKCQVATIVSKAIPLIIAVLMLFAVGCVSSDGLNKPRVASPDCQRSIRVFIIAGQSNAVGYNNIAEYRKGQAEFPEKYLNMGQILFWLAEDNKTGQVAAWGELGIKESGSFGPEIGFAYEMMQAIPDDRLAIIKCAAGGTGIARSEDYSDYIPALKNFDDHNNNWHWPTDHHEAGHLYRILIDNVKTAVGQLEDEGLGWKLTGFIWMQGEHEAGISQKMATDYRKLLGGFIESVRSDLNATDLPFVIGQVNSHSWAYGDIAREGQASYCGDDTDAVLVETLDLSRDGSGGASHFDADGTLELGSRFAAAMNKFIADDEN